MLTQVNISELKISKYLAKKIVHSRKRAKNDARRDCIALPGPPDKNYQPDFFLAHNFLFFQVSGNVNLRNVNPG